MRIERAMRAAARRKVLLTDFDPVAVDAGADPRAVDEIRDCGVPVKAAPI